jgi:spermidine synthase
VDTVEINPAVIPLAEKYFDFDSGKVQVTIGDGRHFLNRAPRQYDVVILDAFVGDSFPSHLMTRETFASIRKILRPGGSLISHSFGEMKPGRDFLLNSLARTLRSEFAGVRIHTNGKDDFFFVARNEADPRPVAAGVLENIHPLARAEVETAMKNTVEIPAESGIVLTDDYNPVDYYDAQNRETLRRRLALTAKKM